VLVFPEAFGLGEHAMSRAERLAGLGYVALACDLRGDGRVSGELNVAREERVWGGETRREDIVAFGGAFEVIRDAYARRGL
jgi:dienelactone hydrolase